MTRRYPVSPILPVRVCVTHPRAAAPRWQAPVASLNTAAMLHRPTAISMPQMLDEHVTPVGCIVAHVDRSNDVAITAGTS